MVVAIPTLPDLAARHLRRVALKIVALFYGIEVLVEERERHWDSLRIGMLPCRTGHSPRPERSGAEAGGYELPPGAPNGSGRGLKPRPARCRTTALAGQAFAQFGVFRLSGRFAKGS